MLSFIVLSAMVAIVESVARLACALDEPDDRLDDTHSEVSDAGSIADLHAFADSELGVIPQAVAF